MNINVDCVFILLICITCTVFDILPKFVFILYIYLSMEHKCYLRLICPHYKVSFVFTKQSLEALEVIKLIAVILLCGASNSIKLEQIPQVHVLQYHLYCPYQGSIKYDDDSTYTSIVLNNSTFCFTLHFYVHICGYILILFTF